MVSRSSLMRKTSVALLGLLSSSALVHALPPWKRQEASSAAPAATPTSTGTPTTSGNATNWEWNWTTDKMHGVALGNWLLLERWMDEQAFVNMCGNSSLDEWSCMESLGDRKVEALQAHWDSWITDDDIRFIAESGFNHIRIPVGYWAFISEPAGTPYASQAGQIEQMDRILESAYNYGLHVVIDLHGLPGSQNGEQPSGHIGYNNFYQGDNPALGDATVDAAIEWMSNTTHRQIITAFSACNEPIFYGNEQYEVLRDYYERTYQKLSTLEPPIPMMFAPGKPETPALQLWQGFINGKNPRLLIYEDHPYIGRMWGTQDQDYMLSQVCSRIQQYANYGVPVAITEWSVSTDIYNNPDWIARFWATQARAWAQSAGGIFWSYRVNAYPDLFNQHENFTLYSFVDIARNGHIPLPSPGQTSEEYIYSLDDFCNLGNTTDTYADVVPSVRPSVTAAFTS